MKIENTLSLANKIKKRILKQLQHIEQDDATLIIRAYHNGREDGFSLTLRKNERTNTVIFSEYRTSDEAVLYKSHAYSEIPTEEEYKKKEFYKTPQDAANAAVKYLIKGIVNAS